MKPFCKIKKSKNREIEKSRKQQLMNGDIFFFAIKSTKFVIPLLLHVRICKSAYGDDVYGINYGTNHLQNLLSYRPLH